MWNPFKFLFQKRNTSVIGIDIGSSAIKVVQIRKKGGKAVLETYGALALGPYAGVAVGKSTNLPIDKLVLALGDIMKEAKVTTKRGGIAIPFSSSLMSVIEMPDVSMKQLETMVPLEARKYIPVPITEVSLDWSIIPKDQLKTEHVPDDESKEKQSPKIGKVDVLVVAIHNDTIAEYESIVKKAGLDANFFEIEIFSTMRSVLDQTPDPIMILDIGAATTKLYIVERGGIRLSHTINKGSQDITSTISASLGVSVEEAEIMKRRLGYSQTSTDGKDATALITLTLDFIFSEAHRVMMTYQQKYAKNISKVMLVGGGASMKGISEIAKKNLQAEVMTGDPFSKVEAPAFLAEVLRTNGPEFAVALGIALRRLQESE